MTIQPKMKLALKVLLAVALFVVISALGAIEIGSLVAFRAIADKDFDRAYKLVKIVTVATGIVYGRDSDKLKTTVVQFSRAIANNTPYLLGGADTGALAVAKLANSLDDDVESAKLFLESSRLANAGFNPNIALGLIHKARERLRKAGISDPELEAEIKVERAYADLASFELEIMRSAAWIDAAKVELLEANGYLCPQQPSSCRFNELRLSIGMCIRSIVLEKDARCIQLDVMKNLNRKVICKGLSDQECAHVVNDLQPYLFQLLSLKQPN